MENILELSLLCLGEHSELIGELKSVLLILGKVSIVEDFESIVIVNDDLDVVHAYERDVRLDAVIQVYNSEAGCFELSHLKEGKRCCICRLVDELKLSSFLLLLLKLLDLVKVSCLPLGRNHLESFLVFNDKVNHVLLGHVLFQERRVRECLLAG